MHLLIVFYIVPTHISWRSFTFDSLVYYDDTQLAIIFFCTLFQTRNHSIVAKIFIDKLMKDLKEFTDIFSIVENFVISSE